MLTPRLGWYFVTVCVKKHECFLGDIKNEQIIPNKFGKIVINCWLQIDKKYRNIKLDEFVLMPNHIHGIIQIIEENMVEKNHVGAIHELLLQSDMDSDDQMFRRKMLLPKIIGYFKMNAAKKINKIRDLKGIPVWHRNYYEHIIRNEDELKRIRQYIKYNPVNWKEDDLYV